MTFGELFLQSPDLFPARPAGEPWGAAASTLDLAGGPYRLEGLSPGQERVLRGRFGERVQEQGPEEGAEEGAEQEAREETRVRVFRAAPSDFRSFDRTGWVTTVDRDYQPRAVRLAGWHFMARLDWRPRLAASLWTSLAEGVELQGVFENFLRVLVAYRLLARGGALVHSVGVVEKGRVVLFLGPSGVGKTTLGRLALAAGRPVLSDDMNAVLGAEEAPSPRFRVQRLPFAGDLGQSAVREPEGSWLLAGLHRLAQGREVRLEPLSPGRALAGLVACCPFVNADPHRREALETNLEELLETVPAGRLTFPEQGPFAAVARVLDTGATAGAAAVRGG